MSHQGAQAGGDVGGALVELAGPDGSGELGLVGETQSASAARASAVTLVEQFALDDAQRVGGHPGVEVDLPGGRLADVGLEEFGDGRDQFGGRRPAVQVPITVRTSSSRSSRSHSVSHTRRPIAASSTERVCPLR